MCVWGRGEQQHSTVHGTDQRAMCINPHRVNHLQKCHTGFTKLSKQASCSPTFSATGGRPLQSSSRYECRCPARAARWPAGSRTPVGPR